MVRLPRQVINCLVAASLIVTVSWQPTPAWYGAWQPTPRERILSAIERGQRFLLNLPQKDGLWRHLGFAPPTVAGINQSDVGATALIGLALLETGLAAEHPAIKAAEKAVIEASPHLTLTYALCTSIWFLDRADRSRHSLAIVQLTKALLRGQLADNGGWSYECPPRTLVSDNSNTQFACLALFIARRHGLSTEAALRLIERRFRLAQDPDTGGWSYLVEMPKRTSGAMTCAGLLALSTGMHVAKSREVRFDARGTGAVLRGQRGETRMPDVDLSPLLRDPAVLKARDYLRSELLAADARMGHLTYFLWSIERTCLVYGWQLLGQTDWYAHGAQLLLRLQNADGSWDIDAQHGAPVDTAFALLFLGRSNLVPELVVFRGGEPKSGAAGPDPAGEKTTEPGRGRSRSGDLPAAQMSLQQITAELPTSAEPRTAELIQRLMTATGDEAVACFLQVIAHPDTKPTVKQKVRQGLAERFAAASTRSLLAEYQSRDRERRLAACMAALVRHRDQGETKPLVASLVTALGDGDSGVSSAAYAALRAITGEDFGPHPAGWQKWWAQQRP